MAKRDMNYGAGSKSLTNDLHDAFSIAINRNQSLCIREQSITRRDEPKCVGQLSLSRNARCDWKSAFGKQKELLPTLARVIELQIKNCKEYALGLIGSRGSLMHRVGSWEQPTWPPQLLFFHFTRKEKNNYDNINIRGEVNG